MVIFEMLQVINVSMVFDHHLSSCVSIVLVCPLLLYRTYLAPLLVDHHCPLVFLLYGVQILALQNPTPPPF
jgi:hypothetical protein